MFRRLYWVSESVDLDGKSRVLGVYTSIPDLVRYGMRTPGSGELRLTLTQLDSERETLGTWTSSNFDSLEEAMQPYVRTEEFTPDQVKSLLEALDRTSVTA